MTGWRLIRSGDCAPAYNMALDEALATSAINGYALPTLRIYGWSTTALSLGAFQKIGSINTDYCTKAGIQLVRRITGGRAILHGDEFTYSISAPLTAHFSGSIYSIYTSIGSIFAKSLTKSGVACEISDNRRSVSPIRGNPSCFQSSIAGELMSCGYKIMGASQRRWTNAFIQQGSIPYLTDDATECAIFSGSVRSSRRGLQSLTPGFDRAIFLANLICAFETAFDIKLSDCQPSEEEALLASRLETERYLDPVWTLAGKAGIRPGSSM